MHNISSAASRMHFTVELFLKLKNSTCVYNCIRMFIYEKKYNYIFTSILAPKRKMVYRILLFLFYINILEMIFLIYFNIYCDILIYVCVSQNKCFKIFSTIFISSIILILLCNLICFIFA